jgi:hypothetical protein
MAIHPVRNGRLRARVVAWSLAIALGLIATPLGCSSSASTPATGVGGAEGAGGNGAGGAAAGRADAGFGGAADAGGVDRQANGTDATADPFAAPTTCTSGQTWSGGNHGSKLMNPGLGCIACHAKSSDAPTLTLAGTVYPTAHEPNLCDGASSAIYNDATVVVTGADQKTIALTPNAAGNFLYQGVLALPFRIKLSYLGRERMMGVAQTSGDCNSCHTQDGADGAPGRIVLP